MHSWKSYTYTTKEELNQLIIMNNLPDFVMLSLKDKQEVAHIRYSPNSCCIILSPLTNEPHRATMGVALIVSEHHVRFIHHHSVSIKDFEQHLQEGNPASLVCQYFSYIYAQYEHNLSKINDKSLQCEQELLKKPEKDNIEKLFYLRKQLIKLQSAITGAKEVAGYIAEEKAPYLYDASLADEYADLRIEGKQLDRTAQVISEIIDSILNVTGTIQANRLNKTMKTLTAITLIISIPTLITSFYGMNIDLPFQDHPHSLLIVSLSSLILTIIVVITLYRKNLL